MINPNTGNPDETVEWEIGWVDGEVNAWWIDGHTDRQMSGRRMDMPLIILCTRDSVSRRLLHFKVFLPAQR